jgi:hypothetical protein
VRYQKREKNPEGKKRMVTVTDTAPLQVAAQSLPG